MATTYVSSYAPINEVTIEEIDEESEEEPSEDDIDELGW
jgi:hypothetical protein